MQKHEAINWVENAAGLTMLVGKDQQITLTDGCTFEVYGTGIVDAVGRLQETLKAKHAQEKECK